MNEQGKNTAPPELPHRGQPLSMQAVARGLVRVSDGLLRATEYTGVAVFTVMTVLIVVQVFFRYVLRNSLSWTEETAIYLFIWLVMLGASVGVRRGFHVAVRFFVERLPGWLRAAVEAVFAAALAVFGLVLAFQGFRLAGAIGGQLSPAARIPMAVVYSAIPISGALSFVHVVAMSAQRVAERVYEAKGQSSVAEPQAALREQPMRETG